MPTLSLGAPLALARTPTLLLTIGALLFAGACTATDGPDGSAASDGPDAASARQGPTLLVNVSIDQLRGDLWEWYAPVFTGGIRRLYDEGFQFTNATHEHSRTTTAAGHATLGTGAYPRNHGIVSNDWWEETEEGLVEVYAVSDPDSPVLGFPELEGRSPGNLFRRGLGDWILEAEPRARVVSISGKDRAAITMAGKSRGHVYWIVPEEGQFTTSTFYRDELPGWVAEFNRSTMPVLYADTVWYTRVPEAVRSLTRSDTTEFERFHPLSYFPHHGRAEVGPASNPEEFRRNLTDWTTDTPVSDRAVAGLAIRAIDELGLGQSGHVDYLALSFSATDHVGHNFGPGSREQLDNFLNLDEQLGRLMDHLDAAVGEGRWAMVLSGDHGVLDAPEVRQARGEVGYRLSAADRERLIRVAYSAAPGVSVGEARSELVASGAVDPRAVADSLEGDPLVERAFTYAELEGAPPADSLALLSYRSYVPGRHLSVVGPLGVVPILPEFFLDRTYLTGSGHGSTYHYDRWVPLFLLGGGQTAGSTAERAATVDVAPTLAAWAGIPVPAEVDGRDIRPR